MYHYVRELQHSRYPNIKGLAREDFGEQIAYIKRHYSVIGADEFITALTGQHKLPPRALMLTFDDGYIDHFTEVFPVLDRYKVSACFFPAGKCVVDRRVLDVNKIHFILASVENKQLLVDFVKLFLTKNGPLYGLLSFDAYWQRVGRASRFDTAEVVFLKRMLQRELPSKLRSRIVDELFRRYVTSDEIAFAAELYMSCEQLRMLTDYGMYVGCHGYEHVWLNSLDKRAQTEEIDRSLGFLASVGANIDRWIMCYPYGAWDDNLQVLLKARGCVAGLTTRVDLARIGDDHPFQLPRLDTNDLPKSGAADEAEWTRRASTAA